MFDLTVDAREKAMDISVIRGEQAVVQSAAAVVEQAVACVGECW
jgi:hypothetical protein